MFQPKLPVEDLNGGETMYELDQSCDSCFHKRNSGAGRFCSPRPASRGFGTSDSKALSPSMTSQSRHTVPTRHGTPVRGIQRCEN